MLDIKIGKIKSREMGGFHQERDRIIGGVAEQHKELKRVERQLEIEDATWLERT